MAIIIEYTNQYNEFIAKKQAESMSEYNKITKENSIVIKVEYFLDNILNGIYYYLQDGEDEQKKVNELTLLVSRFVEIREREYIGSKILVRERYYLKRRLEAKSNLLIDDKGNELCNEVINLKTNKPNWEKTEKYLYSRDNEVIAGFDYNKDGSLRSIWGDMVENANIYKDDGAGWNDESIYGSKINEYFPNLLTNNPYYANANFIT